MIPVDLPKALEVLRRGDALVYPTETLYGLGVAVDRPEAVDRLFQIKGRSGDKAVSLLVAAPGDIQSFCGPLDPFTRRLVDRYLPGPLTLVLPALPSVPKALTGGGDWVGIRISSHPLAQELVRALGHAITSTSANPSGEPGACTRQQVQAYFGNRDEVFFLDGGDLPPSRGSTVVRVEAGRIKLLREGEIPFTEIENYSNCGI